MASARVSTRSDTPIRRALRCSPASCVTRYSAASSTTAANNIWSTSSFDPGAGFPSNVSCLAEIAGGDTSAVYRSNTVNRA